MYLVSIVLKLKLEIPAYITLFCYLIIMLICFKLNIFVKIFLKFKNLNKKIPSVT